jgi:hypothetical protein
MTFMRTLAITIAVFATVLSARAEATVINTNWFSNATSNTNIVEGVFNGSERPRLGNFTSGSISGTVFLPFFDTWTIDTLIRTDESVTSDPTDTVTVFIDNVQLAVFANAPLNTDIPFTTMITGSQFDYRFDFLSGNAIEVQHMLVLNGTATAAVAEPGITMILGLGLLGFGLARYKTRT